MNTFMAADRPVVVVDLAAIAFNWKTANAAYTGKRIGAVLKSDAYGLGLPRIGAWLAELGCRDFWVATFEEAVQLRELAPEARIFMLHGLRGAPAADFQQHRIVPVLTSKHELALARSHALNKNAAVRFDIAVHLDTGLSRLGLNESEVQEIARDPGCLDGMHIVAWVTTLSCVTGPRTPACQAQRRRFAAWTRILPPAQCSLATSSGIFSASDWHLDMARVGSALYGVQTSADLSQDIEPAVMLSAPIVHVAKVPASAMVGYGNPLESATVPADRLLATIAIGYGDGLPCSWADNGEVVIDGQRAPVVGGMSMSVISADISAYAPGRVRAGMRAEIFGKQLRLEHAARAAGISPNELLVSTAKQSMRAYLEPGKMPALRRLAAVTRSRRA